MSFILYTYTCTHISIMCRVYLIAQCLRANTSLRRLFTLTIAMYDHRAPAMSLATSLNNQLVLTLEEVVSFSKLGILTIAVHGY